MTNCYVTFGKIINLRVHILNVLLTLYTPLMSEQLYLQLNPLRATDCQRFSRANASKPNGAEKNGNDGKQRLMAQGVFTECTYKILKAYL